MASSCDGVLFPFFQEGVMSDKSHLLMFLRKNCIKPLSQVVFSTSSDSLSGLSGGGGVINPPSLI